MHFLALSLDDAPSPALHAALQAAVAGVLGAPDSAALFVLDASRSVRFTDLPFVAIDVETTGFSPDRDRVVEVGVVRYAGGLVERQLSTLIRTNAPLPPAVARLTGIDDGERQGAPDFAAFAPALEEACRGAAFLVGYNASFDAGFLSAELARLGRPPLPLPWIDPLRFVRRLDPAGAKKDLGAAAARHGVALDHAHRALDDARATGDLLLKLAPRLPAWSLQDALQAQERARQGEGQSERHGVRDDPPSNAAAAADAAPARSWSQRILQLFG